MINKTKDNSDYHSNFSLIYEKLCTVLESNLVLYNKDQTNRKQICNFIKTLIIIMYIIFYNIKECKNVILFFKMNYFTIIKILNKAITIFKDDKENISVAKLIINLCFDELREKVYEYGNDKLNEIYQKYAFSEMLGIFPSINEQFDSKNEELSNFMKNIIEIKWDNYITNLKKENSDIICQNIIPLLLSEPNFDFISFFDKLVDKHIEIIREEYDNEITSLFRKDDFTNDLIKNVIYIFGNFSFIKSFYIIMPNEYVSVNDINFDISNFEVFLNSFITNLTRSLPFIIKILLNIIKNKIKIITGEDNYNAIYTVLIFNFFISPTILEFYGLSLIKYKSLRQLTRLLRNIFFNREFDPKDNLSYFNKKINIFNSFINDNFKINVFDGIDIEKDKDNINKEINTILVNAKNQNLINGDKSILLPSFCYKYYWDNIVSVLNTVKNEHEN